MDICLDEFFFVRVEHMGSEVPKEASFRFLGGRFCRGSFFGATTGAKAPARVEVPCSRRETQCTMALG